MKKKLVDVALIGTEGALLVLDVVQTGLSTLHHQLSAKRAMLSINAHTMTFEELQKEMEKVGLHIEADNWNTPHA